MDKADLVRSRNAQSDCAKLKRGGLRGRYKVNACSSKSGRNYLRKCKSASDPPSSHQTEFHELVAKISDNPEEMLTPVTTRQTRLSEKKSHDALRRTPCIDTPDLTPESRLNVHPSLFSCCMTRAQSSRAKELFGESSAFTSELFDPKKLAKKIHTQPFPDQEQSGGNMQVDSHLPSTSASLLPKISKGNNLKVMLRMRQNKKLRVINGITHQLRYSQMKRKHEVLNETAKSPEKKACKSSVGSIIATSTAVLPTAASLQQRPVTRARSTRKTRLSSTSSESESSASSPRTSSNSLLTAPPLTPVKHLPQPNDSNEWLNRFLSWNSAEKIVVLDRLVGVCQPHEVRHMLDLIEPQFQRDFISLLPKEQYGFVWKTQNVNVDYDAVSLQQHLLKLYDRDKRRFPLLRFDLALYVLSFLEPRDLLVAAQTCKYWRALAEDNLMWKEKCIEEGIVDRGCVKSTKIFPKSKKAFNMGVGSSWKVAFLRQVRIEANWRTGSEKPIKLLKGHDDHVITCLQFSGSRILSGSDDNTLKVWSAVSGKCLRTLTGHTGGVWASQMRNNLIISGSTDRTLKIWNADSGECVHTLYGHTSTVRCLALHDNIVVSGSRDATLRVWDIDTGVCQHVLVGHMAAVRCVCYDGKKVVSGAYDYMVKVWDPVNEECLHTLQGHSNRVYSLQFDGKYVVSGSLDTSIRVWELETGTCLHTLMGHQSLTSGMELKDNILVSGNADSTVKIWDIKTGECLKTLEGPNKHLSAVTCLQFHGKFVITSSDDGTVKLWDVKTGKVIRNLVTLDSRGSGGVVWRIRASRTKLVCAVGSRNGTEETKLQVIDFEPDAK